MAVTKGEWKATKSATGDWCLSQHNEATGYDELICRVLRHWNKDLILSAVNACQKVNPDNPQAVAEAITKLYEALKVATTRIHNQIRYEEGDYRKLLQDTLRECQQALNLAEGKG